MADETQQAVDPFEFAAIVKAHIVDAHRAGGAQLSNAVTIDEHELVRTIGSLPPPYPPELLCALFEQSVALRPNVDAMVQNVAGFGVRLEPRIDLTSNKANEQIEDAILIERLEKGDADPVVSPEEIATRRKEIERGARVEKLRLERWLETCAYPISFAELRRRTKHDYEQQANAYWEIRRNGLGDVHRIGHVPAASMRLMPIDLKHTAVMTKRRLSAVTVHEEEEQIRFRRYAQIVMGQESIYFKQFGDQRTMSSRNGRYYDSPEALEAAEPGTPPATEIYHWSLYSSRSAYGIPRWIGAWLAVLGSRASEEVNYLYFDNKGVPPMAITVSGGRLAKDAPERIKQHIEENIKGRANYHKVMILEAVSGDTGTANASASQVRIRIEPLTAAQHTDALFQDYKANCTQDVRAQFRLSPIITGDQRDANRATADAVLAQAEQQVFQPEREADDFVLNDIILASNGIRYWKVVSNSPITKDPPTLAKMIVDLVAVGVLTPAEGRTLARDVFNLDLPELDDEWTKRPLAITLATLQAAAAPSGESTTGAPTERDIAQRLLDLRDQLRARAGQSFEQHVATKAAGAELEEEIIQVPRSIWENCFEREPAEA